MWIDKQIFLNFVHEILIWKMLAPFIAQHINVYCNCVDLRVDNE